MYGKLNEKLEAVRRKWAIKGLFARGARDDTFWESLEEILISGDVGSRQTEEIILSLRERTSSDTSDSEALGTLSSILCERLRAVEGTGMPVRFSTGPTVVMLNGVNGSGKTTTAAKLAWILGNEGKKVLIAAADTFRAGAVEQLNVWGSRAGVRVISHTHGGDPGAVVFDAIRAVEAGNFDCLIVDTAGRLHNKTNLMEELSKISRIIDRNCQGWTLESFLVVDAVSGQNGLKQAEVFGGTVPLTGLIITKYDHAAKGGIILSAGNELGLPVRYVGIGENMDDLKLLEPEEFVNALLGI